MKQIPLTRGYEAIVDDVDYEALAAVKWHAHTSPVGKVYAVRNLPKGERRSSIRMHQVIMGATGIDHRNGDSLDNRRSNLRVATDSQNQQNRRAINNKHGFKGVYHHPYTQNQGKRWTRHKPWKAEIQVEGRRVSLGYHLSAQEAADAYDRGAIRYFGEFAATNAELLG